MAALDDEQVAALDLRHDAAEDAVYEGVEGRVANDVMGYVDKEAFVGRDGRRKSMENVGESRYGTVAKIVT